MADGVKDTLEVEVDSEFVEDSYVMNCVPEGVVAEKLNDADASFVVPDT